MSHSISKALCPTFKPAKRSARISYKFTKCNRVLKNQFKYSLHTLRKHRISHIISKALCLTFQPVKRGASEYKLEITKCNKVLKNQFKYSLHTLNTEHVTISLKYYVQTFSSKKKL